MREFMPGPCAYDPEVATVFEEVEQNIADAATESIARVACGNCVQRVQCEDQRDQIAVELAKQKTVDRAVIAGVVVDMRVANKVVAQQGVLERLRDSAIKFDISQLPATATAYQRLNFIRQALRTKQLSLSSGKPTHLEQYKEMVKSRLPQMPDLDSNKRDEIIHYGAALAMRFRGVGLSPKIRRHPLSEADINQAHGVFDAFVADAVAMAQQMPVRFMAYHEPELYAKIVNAPLSNVILPKGKIKGIIRNAANDPIPVIMRHYRAQEDAARQIPLGNYGVSVRTARIKRAEPLAEVQDILKTTTSLREKYPLEKRATLAALAAKFMDDPCAAVDAYIAARDSLTSNESLAMLSQKQLDAILRQDPYKAAEVAARTVARMTESVKVADKAGISLPNIVAFKVAETQYHITPEIVTRFWYDYRGHSLYNNASHRPKMWVARRIAETVDEPLQAETVELAGNLIRRGLLEYVVNDIGEEQKELVWSSDADYLTEHEKQAIIHATNLVDILGAPCSQNELAEILGTTDLRELVDHVLAPGLFPPDPIDILANIRYEKANPQRRHGQKKFADEVVRYRDEIISFLSPHISTGDEAVDAKLLRSFANGVVGAFPNRRYRKSVRKIRPTELIQEAFLPYVHNYYKNRTIEDARSFLAKDPVVIARVLEYAEGLSNLYGNLLNRARVRANPLAFIRHCQRTSAYLSGREDTKIFTSRELATLLPLASTDEIDRRIKTIHTALARHKTDSWTSPGLIKNTLLKLPKKDAETVLLTAIATARQLHGRYGSSLDKPTCIHIAFARRNPAEFAKTTVQKMNSLLQIHHPGIHMSNKAAYRIVTTTSPATELEGYIARYQQALQALHDLDSTDHSDDVIANIVATTKKPEALAEAIRNYVTTSRDYRDIPVVDQSTVDTAFLLYTSKQAHIFLRRMCAKLRYNTSLDAPLHNSLSLHAIVSDGISAEDAYLGTYTPDPLDQQDKRTLILSKLDSLRTVEQAAVLVVFGLQDLMSDDMAQQELDDPIVISRALGLQDTQSLENYVRAGILPKISE